MNNFNVILYTKLGCPLCETTKNILNENKVPFQEYKIGEQITREEVLKRFPTARMAPVIVVNGIVFNLEGLNRLIIMHNQQENQRLEREKKNAYIHEGRRKIVDQ
jgi:glutaredoxin